MTEQDLIARLRSGAYAFLDPGSGDGDSTARCEQRFGLGRGLGIERDEERVQMARDAGLDVYSADALAIVPPSKCVAFSSMCDFLEHLPDERFVRRALEAYGTASRDFLFIQHPSFEHIEDLAKLGLKVCWSDWTDHTTMMTIDDYQRMFASLGWHDVTIHPINPIFDSFHHTIIPFATRGDADAYDPSIHDAKPLIEFDWPLYARYDIFVRLNPGLDDAEWKRITSPVDRIVPDGGDTVAIFDRDAGLWTVRTSVLDDAGRSTFAFGEPGTRMLPIFGDWDGDGESGAGLYDREHGVFHLSNGRHFGVVFDVFNFGPVGGLPIVGDWSGAGADGVGVYDPASGQFWLKNKPGTGEADFSFGFGPVDAGFLPFAGDWNGAGIDTVGLFDPATATFFLAGSHASGAAAQTFNFGPAGAVPIVGDWDGDGRDGLGVYVPDTATWRLRCDLSEGLDDVRFRFGRSGSAPIRIRATRNHRTERSASGNVRDATRLERNSE